MDFLKIPPQDDNDRLNGMLPGDVPDYTAEEYSAIIAAIRPPTRTYTDDELLRARYVTGSNGAAIPGRTVLAGGDVLLVLATGSTTPVRPNVESGLYVPVLDGEA